MRLAAVFLAGASLAAADDFTERIRPALQQNCGACHGGAVGKPKGPAPFLKATTAADVESSRGLWRNVAAQLRNRTMPPPSAAAKLTEDDRLRIASWIDARLRQTACSAGEWAGPAITRRLNRREYHHTIRDLFGVDFEIATLLPADGTGGAGFDTNGETLYVPPVLMERYMEAAQQILDRAIVTPPVIRDLTPAQMPGLVVKLPAYSEAAFDVTVYFEQPADMSLPDEAPLDVQVDGASVGKLKTQPRRIVAAKPFPGPTIARFQLNLSRGSHTVAFEKDHPKAPRINRILIAQRQDPPSAERRANHYRLFGADPGERPQQPRVAARRLLASFLPNALRRPVQPAEIDRFMALYDRAEQRGDPWEERIKLALKAVLVWPEFLFRIEQKHSQPGIYPLGQYELASRLSYFLWSSPPDEPLLRLASEVRLQDAKALAEQVDRMLDDPRSRSFIGSFMGQWLGTQDIGGRVVPLLTELQSYYTPDVAADLRAQPVLLFDRIVGENRSLLELLTADYTHMTRRLAKFYQVEKELADANLDDQDFRLVKWPDNRRAGILGLGGVLAMSSRYKETSPVLRGAWVLDTLLGTPVPPPPPDVPPLKTDKELGAKLRMREKLMQHRADPSCSACHRLMDPIGFGLENFDWMGRWRDKEETSGELVDADGELPTGEKFNGPVELRNVLLARKDDFVASVVSRVFGYALGRSLRDGDSCAVQRISDMLAKDGYRARTLIREIVLSTAFRNTQGGAAAAEHEPVISQRRIDISGINALKQDAASHNNEVKLDKLKTPPPKRANP